MKKCTICDDQLNCYDECDTCLTKLAARQSPLDKLKHHVTGAIERGEAEAITAIPIKPVSQLAQEALNVQNACNLCGVAQGFALAMVALGSYTKGTDERNTHPIAQLWAYKISALSGQEYLESPVFESAYNRCALLAKGYES